MKPPIALHFLTTGFGLIGKSLVEQEKINLNVQERLATLEVHEQVFIAMLFALIKTHPHPELFQKLFDAHVEAFRARLLGEAIPDEILDEVDELHALLRKAFSRSMTKTKKLDPP